MPQGNMEDKDDVFIENLNLALFLLLGVLAVSASVILLGYSAIGAVFGLQLSISPLTSLGFSAFLFTLGAGAVHWFHRQRKARKNKRALPF